MISQILNIFLFIVLVYPSSCVPARAERTETAVSTQPPTANVSAHEVCYEDTGVIINALVVNPEYQSLFDDFVSLQVSIQEGYDKKVIQNHVKSLVKRVLFIQKFASDPVLTSILFWLQRHHYMDTPAQSKRKRLQKLVIAGTVIGAAIAAQLVWNAIRKNRIQRRINEVLMSEPEDAAQVALRYNTELARAVAQDYKDVGWRKNAVQTAQGFLRTRRISLCSRVLRELNRRRARGKLRGEHARGRRLWYYNGDRPVFGVDLHTSGGDIFGDRANYAEEAYARRTGSGMPLLTLKGLGEMARAQSGRSQRNPVMEVVLASKLDKSESERKALPPGIVSIIHEYLVGPPSQRERMLQDFIRTKEIPESESGGAGQGVVDNRLGQVPLRLPRHRNWPGPTEIGEGSDDEALS
jgi:hypothetical protein